MKFEYPRDLVEPIVNRLATIRFPEQPPAPQGDVFVVRNIVATKPQREFVEEMLEVVYHTSFLTEESRKLSVRLAFLNPPDFANRDPHDLLLHNPPVALLKPRSCTPKEVIRLAPAVDPSRSMIAVRPKQSGAGRKEDAALEIWGVMDLGSEYWNFLRAQNSATKVLPDCFTVTSYSPGTLRIAFGGEEWVRLENGQKVTPVLNHLSQGHIGRFLKQGADKLYADALTALHDRKFSQDADEDGVPRRLFYPVFQSIVVLAAERRHGATLIVVHDDIEPNDVRLTERIDLKYAIEPPEIWNELVKGCVAYRRFFGVPTEKRSRQDAWRWPSERMIDFENFVANLSAVDGAVVITLGCRVLGFGGEIKVPAEKQPQTVHFAKNPEATSDDAVDVRSLGTRHRSVFRLCSDFKNCIAFVISQDGPAKAVKKVGDKVCVWDCAHLLPAP